MFKGFINQTVFKVRCMEEGVNKNEVWWPQPTMPWLIVVQIKTPLSHKSSEVSDIDSYHIIGFVLPMFLTWCAAVKAMELYGKIMDSSVLCQSLFPVKTGKEPEVGLSDKVKKWRILILG